ncbi:MAG: IclR family transcriptional regulator [Gemmatimonadota bacterium]|nr:IclR family transcriptional regulator [Gemmatimonadota bacterium]
MLQQCMRVLELFSPTAREIGVVDAARRLGEGKGTVSRWLSAMEESGFVDRDPVSHRYRLSTRLAVLGEFARDSSSLHRLALPELQWLAAATGETSNLAVLVGSEVMNVSAVESPRPIMHTGWVGRRLPCHATASGKALLAWKDPADVRRLFPRDLPRLAQRTITRMDELIAELGVIRVNGYSVAWAELEDDLAAVGAPVRDHTGLVVGALSIGAPVSRVPPEQLDAHAQAVRQAARSLSAQLGYHARN